MTACTAVTYLALRSRPHGKQTERCGQMNTAGMQEASAASDFCGERRQLEVGLVEML